MNVAVTVLSPSMRIVAGVVVPEQGPAPSGEGPAHINLAYGQR